MSINLTILQNFNNAVNSNAALSGNARLQNGTFKLGGTYDIKQIPSNRYDRAANNAVRRNFAAALAGAFGVKSLEDLPENVRKSLNIGDFKLDKEGNITSTRPSPFFVTASPPRQVSSSPPAVRITALPRSSARPPMARAWDKRAIT